MDSSLFRVEPSLFRVRSLFRVEPPCVGLNPRSPFRVEPSLFRVEASIPVQG